MFGEQKLDSLEAAKDDWMKKYITDALRIHGGKRGETAKALGIGERTLFRYLDQLHINDKSL
jgi:DNA-binding NtrC family response regulator